MFTALFAFVALSAANDDAKMQIFVDNRAVLFVGVSQTAAIELAKSSGFDKPSDWPLYADTGHPLYVFPPRLMKLAKSHPEWKLDALLEYRIAFRTLEKDRTILLYNQETKILIILYVRIKE